MRKSEEEPRAGEPTRTWKNEREAPVFLQGTVLPGPKISLSLNPRGTFFSFFSNLVRIIYFILKELVILLVLSYYMFSVFISAFYYFLFYIHF